MIKRVQFFVFDLLLIKICAVAKKIRFKSNQS